MNNKGFTTVEVLLCFIIVSVIMMTMFTTISSLNDKRIQESNRAKIYEFKNEITNLIQDDIVKRGVLFVETKVNDTNKNRKYEMNIKFGDGTEKILRVFQQFTRTENHNNAAWAGQDDEFYIEYGTVDDEIIRYYLPDLGYLEGRYEEVNGKYIFNTKTDSSKVKSYDFQINTVDMYVTNDRNSNGEGQVLVIYIGFYHPDFGTKYAINIVAPLNYLVGDGAIEKFEVINEPVPNPNDENFYKIYLP